jgi:YHS domain-containing protein
LNDTAPEIRFTWIYNEGAPQKAPSLFLEGSIAFMLRAILELVLTIAAIAIAKAVLSSIVKGITSAGAHSSQAGPAAGSPRARGQQTQSQASGGTLHRDPVCGTFVADSTPFQRQGSQQSFFYCSANCRDAHRSAAG